MARAAGGKRGQRGLLQALPDLLAVGGEVLAGDVVFPEVVLRAAGVREAPHGAPEERPVKAAEDITDRRGEPAKKRLDGVAAVGAWWRETSRHSAGSKMAQLQVDHLQSQSLKELRLVE
jgi:hypothetical protein